MKKLNLTEKQRISFQDRLPDRVHKKDINNILTNERFHIEYFYGSIDFGKLMKSPEKSKIIKIFSEVQDNCDTDKKALLFFSRPSMPIYVVFDSSLWLEQISPVIYINIKNTGNEICISTLENFLYNFYLNN